MKIKSFAFVAIFAIAFLSFGNIAKASCLEENFAQKTDAEKVQCLTSVIASLTQQITTILAQQGGGGTTSATWCHNFNAYLKAGDNGNEVSELNRALSFNFYGTQDPADYSNFDDQMASWVVRFQTKYGITQTGTVGPLTRGKLNQLYACQARILPTEDESMPLTQSSIIIFTPSRMSSGWLPISGDWNGDGKDTIGLYDPATSIFHLRNSNTQGVADITFAYGSPNSGWIPIAGDWNGDGEDTVGLYDPATSMFHLRNYNTSGNANITFAFGSARANWIPIAGDWNGDGEDSVGLYDSAYSQFYLRNYNTAGNADISFGFGAVNTSWPVAGDWNGDGKDTIGLYNPATAIFSLRNSNTFGTADITFAYGTLNNKWLPIAGDWNRVGTTSDKADTIGLFDPASAHFYLRNYNTSGNSDTSFGFGVASVVTPSITVTSPTGGESWQIGTTHNITWTSSNLNSTRLFSIYLMRKSPTDSQYWNVKTIAQSQQQNGTFNWTVTNDILVTGATYKITVGEQGEIGNERVQESNYFTIIAATLAPSITVTSPTGGETWQIGTTHNITWTSSGLPSNAALSIGLNGDGITSTIAGAQIVTNYLASTGLYQWTVPTTMPPATPGGESLAGKKYSVYLMCTNCGSLVGYSSENYFTITAPIVTPVTCTSFTYSAWSTCANNTQTRTIATMTPSGCTGGTPETLSQTCTVASNSTWLPISGKWMAQATKDTIGLYDPASSQFYLRTTNTTGTADISFGFGAAGAGWLPIVGDWNHDHIDTVGLYDPTTSTFHLRNSNSTGNADITFAFGTPNAGWLPIAGDWNGDGVVTVGLYDPASSHFYLRNYNTSGNADISFGFGASGWKPVAGDWNGDGVDTIGAYDPSASQFYLRNYNATGNADISFGFGAPGWRPVMGDWDENAVSTAGLLDPSTSTFYLRNTNTTGAANITFKYGALTSFAPQNSVASISDALNKILEEFRELLLK